MKLCARCLETGTETPAEYFTRIVEYFHQPVAKWIKVENDGANVCKVCLDYTKEVSVIKLEIKKLVLA